MSTHYYHGLAVKLAVFAATLLPTGIHAVTLSEAVNAQLETISLPCDRLLGGDPISVLTGELATIICSRFVPFGSTPQNQPGSAANLSTLSGGTPFKKDEQAQEEVQIGARWTLFLTAESEILNRDDTDAEGGFDSDAARLLAGATYAVTSDTNIGLAVSFQAHEGDYVQGGDFETDSNGLRALLSHNFTDQLFLQLAAGFDDVSSKRTRNANFEEYFNGGLVFAREGDAESDFDYDQTELSLLMGFNAAFGSVTLVPQFAITWLDIDYGTYSETGASGLELTFHDDQYESLQSRLGLQATMAVSTGFGVVVPQLDVNWVQEHEDESRQVNVSFSQDTRAKQFSYDTEAPDNSFFEFGVGSVFLFAGGNQLFIRAETLLGHDFYDNYLFSAGLNIEL